MSARGRRARFTALAMALSLAATQGVCAPASFAEDTLRKPGLRPSNDTAEAGLWTLSDNAEINARQSAELNRDPALTEYVRTVACKVAAGYCDDLRVYVMDRPFFNASMAPNGYMEVWSGTLLRARNEDELAFVLGHEIGHYALSHTWQSFQDIKSRADGAMIASLLISAAGVVAMANAGSNVSVQNISSATQGLVSAVYLGAVAGMFAFSRESESEADTYGFHASVKSAYDSAAPVAIWQRLRAETAASDFEAVRKGETRASIFDSHPLVIERVQSLEKLSRTQASRGAMEAKTYRAAIRPHLGAWLRSDLLRRDFGETLFLIDQLAADGADLGVLNFYRGEAMRLRRSPGYQAEAEKAYRAAIAYPDVPAVAYRELADLAEKRREKNEMADLLIKYLQNETGAKDAAFVRMRIEQVKPIPSAEPPAQATPISMPATVADTPLPDAAQTPASATKPTPQSTPPQSPVSASLSESPQ